MADEIPQPLPTPAPPKPAAQAGNSLKFPLTVIGIYWIGYIALGFFGLHMFTVFLSRAGLTLALGIILGVWWFRYSGLSWKVRLGHFAFFLLCGTIATLLLHPMLLPPVIYLWSVPACLTAGTLLLWLGQSASPRAIQIGLLAVIALSWVPGTLVRGEGLNGDGSNDIHWRWSPTAEDQFLKELAEQPKSPITNVSASEPMAEANDWIVFRGPTGDSQVTDLKIATDWKSSPPKIVWKHRVGPGWSSMTIAGDRLFTQEQRDAFEVVACYSTSTGQQLWEHGAEDRIVDPLGGPGPRATPAFFEGRVYTVGAKGRLECLDARDGKVVWAHDDVPDKEVPVWGFSASPVIAAGKVIAFLGGEERGLVAYDAATGDLKWKAKVGKESYSSPVVVTLHGREQVLYLGDDRLASFDPETGDELWDFPNPEKMGRPTVQPQVVDGTNLLLSFAPSYLMKIQVDRTKDDKWVASELWNKKSLKPDYSDYVVYGNAIYGFDADIFCCVDLESGDRNWKGGRYGTGQALLLANQGVMLILSEKGELVLVECNPEKHVELAKLPVIVGKTWNHPARQGSRIFVRNAEEMACVELPVE